MTNKIKEEPSNKPKLPSDGASFSFLGGDFKPPPGRVVGVYYDKQRKIWRANWREGEVGKRKTKNFSVDDYGFEEARRLAIEYRLMKITEIAQMELNCNDIDRLRLSTCRAPAQSSTDRKSYDDKISRKRSVENITEPYGYGNAVPPPSGDYFDPNAIDPMLFWNPSQFPTMQPTEFYGDIETGNNMWFYNPEILFNLYQQHGMTNGMAAKTSTSGGANPAEVQTLIGSNPPAKVEPVDMMFRDCTE